MSNVIAFLESLGNNAAQSRLSGEEYVAAVDALGLDDAPRQALLDRDADALNGLMGGRLKMMCLLFPADGDDQKKDGQEDGEQPVQDDEKKEAIRHHGRH
ncbi:hypothetical protein [Arenimonas sp. MALMAid1274]|uniref:hypothetical protein n=1 Tax=Arenimonas sp. MALMAid1274 TaxID=3411630 RepID=UPI003B9E24EF